MNREDNEKGKNVSRRKFLSLTGGIVAGSAALGMIGRAANGANITLETDTTETEPFWGLHQGGIATPAQKHTYFAAFDLNTSDRGDVVGLLRRWAAAAARLTDGQTAEPLSSDPSQPGADSADAYGLSPARLTVTFGFGPGLFVKNGIDRFNLSAHRPIALVDLPTFNGDQLLDAHTGGDLSIQACADDPQVAFHAVRQIARLAYGAADIRWAQTGFLPNTPPGQTPRNLMGFKDGTQNLSSKSEAELNDYVWVGKEGSSWMRGGSYLVVRRIRVALEHWDRMPVSFQEQTFGRHKYSGAPLGGRSEFESMNLDASDGDGNPIIAQNAHARLAAAATNDGSQILRRPYSYNDGLAFTAERWPPWRQGMEYDAGLLFFAYQKDPRTGFIKIFDVMSKIDMLNQFATHVGGGLFACPPGAQKGEYIGQSLFELG
jgi:deferrochelatase/peroxidase EfeB